jgi:hypothetical protein
MHTMSEAEESLGIAVFVPGMMKIPDISAILIDEDPVTILVLR